MAKNVRSHVLYFSIFSKILHKCYSISIIMIDFVQKYLRGENDRDFCRVRRADFAKSVSHENGKSLKTENLSFL